MAVINKNPDFMAMPLGFKRGNPIALDTTAVWYSYEEMSAYAASSPVAYVGQILSLVNEASNAATAYMIMDAAGTLQEVGKATLGDNKTITLEDGALSLKNWGVQYYKWIEGEGDNPGQHVLQVVNEENPWIAGLEPKTSLEEGQIVIAWYQPSTVTVEDVNSALSSVQSTVNNITGVLGTKDDVAGTNTVFGQLAGKVDTTGDTMTGALILADGHEAISDNAVDTKIANAIGSAGHLKRLVVDALPEASAADADTIYMVKDASVTLGDAYKEYMLIDGALVQIGDTSVDLEPYATKVMLTTHENNSVLCTPQTLTEAQQAQARENIGAADVVAVNGLKDDLEPLQENAVRCDELITSADYDNEIVISNFANGQLANNGTVVTSENYAVTDFIPIENIEQIYRYGTLTKFNLRGYCIYDSNRNLLKFRARTTDYDFVTVNGHTDATVYNLFDDNNVKGAYIRIEKELGERENEYTFVQVPAKAQYYLETKDISCPSIRKLLNVGELGKTSNNYMLLDKNIVCFGDSIFGKVYDDTGVCRLLEKRLNATVINAAFGGTRMCDRGTTTTGFDQFDFPKLSTAVVSRDFSGQENALSISGIPSYYAERLNTLKNVDFRKVDIVTFNFGTNDYTGFGDIRAEYITEMNNCIGRLQTAYPHITFVAISPTWRLWLVEGQYSEDSDTKIFDKNVTLPQLCETMKSVCTDSLHIPFIDCYNIGINKHNFAQYFSSNDGTHHDINGRIRLADHISRQIVAI